MDTLDVIELRIAEVRRELSGSRAGLLAFSLTKELRSLERIHASVCDLIDDYEHRGKYRVTEIRDRPDYELPKPECGFKKCRTNHRAWSAWWRRWPYRKKTG